MRQNKKWTIGRIILLILGVLLAGLVAAAAIAFPYYDGFQKPARSYEALAREMEKLEDVYLPDKPPEDATDVSYTYQLENRFLWSKPIGYGLNWVESVEGTRVRISVWCFPTERIAGSFDFYINDIGIEKSIYELNNDVLEYAFYFSIGGEDYEVGGYVKCNDVGNREAERREKCLEKSAMRYVTEIIEKSQQGGQK